MLRRALLGIVSDERVRFLIAGGINTVIGYGLFAFFELTFGEVIGYLGSLYASYLIAICIAYSLHRSFTFRVSHKTQLLPEFLRFASVYVVALGINTLALPVLVEFGRLEPLAAQAIVVVVTTLLSYFGHKLFSFRQRSSPGDARSEPPA